MSDSKTFKHPMDVVKEIYHEWQWCEDKQFLTHVQEMNAHDFAIQLHHGPGTNIRNTFGLWKSESELHQWFRFKGIEHPDDMSHYILVELHKYALSQLAQ